MLSNMDSHHRPLVADLNIEDRLLGLATRQYLVNGLQLREKKAFHCLVNPFHRAMVLQSLVAYLCLKFVMEHVTTFDWACCIHRHQWMPKGSFDLVPFLGYHRTMEADDTRAAIGQVS